MKNIFQLLFAVICLFTTTNPLHAQWIKTNVPYGGFVTCFTVSGMNLFAGTWGGGVWRRPLSQMVSVSLSVGELPTKFSLGQNYPNPFNPSTTISFSLPSKSFVLLKVFNVLGREVSILVSDELPAGTYAQQWNAATLPSGVYFYRLHAGSYNETKKLLLIR